MNISDFVDINALKNYTNSVAIKPNIPRQKALNAIEKYAKGVKANDIEILFDDTILGSAKRGFLVTNKAIYIYTDFKEAVYHYDIKDIKSIEVKNGFFSFATGSSICINGEKCASLTSGEDDLEIIVQAVNSFIAFGGASPRNKSERSIFKEYDNDELMDFFMRQRGGRKTEDAIDMVTNIVVESVLDGIFGSNGSNKNFEKSVENAIADYYIKCIIEIRNTYINGIRGLENNLATMEIICFLSMLLGRELSSYRYSNDEIMALIFTGLKTFNKHNKDMDNFFFLNATLGVTNEDEQSICGIFYIKLFLSNFLGRISPDEALEYTDEMKNYLNHIFPHIYLDDLDDIMDFVMEKSIEEIGDITQDVNIRQAVENTVQYIVKNLQY